MNQGQKAVILTFIVFFSGISYFSWKVITRDNRQPIAHQEKKNDRQEKDEDSPEIIQDDHQEKNYFWLGIIIGIILFLFIAVIIYVFIKRNRGAGEISYDNWVCGVKIEGNKMQLVLWKKWDANAFVEQIFQTDTTRITNDGDDRLKKFYDEKINNEKQIKNIKNFLNYHIGFLSYLNASFLKKIQEPEIQKALQKNKKDDDDNETLSKLASNFEQGMKNKHDNNPIVLNDVEIVADDGCADVEVKNDENFDQINFWEFFKSLIKSDKPTAYVKKENEKNITITPLFKYSYTLEHLIFPIISGLNSIVTNINAEKQIFTDNEVNEIQDILDKLAVLEKQKA